ncbi:glutathione peroxidase 6 isoform X1 [Callithrix jacchus]|uniref:glutathione peroxidase 6 isoform X1 n=1 Tax=Callithrix jacchus TaxID=9483 RepID=UPI000840831E|nr:glutathione peroxidase 6 isoform X1 [Callithrix jacchus]
MIRQFQASCLVPLFLVSFAQQTLKPEDRKVDCNKNVTGTIYEYGALTLSGEEYIQFKQFAGKPVLFVNVASYCSLTAQYPELNALQEELKSLGVTVLGFPCNQFGKQEPGANSEILLGLKYVRPGSGFVPNFQLFEKGDVNGEKEQKVFTFLKSQGVRTTESQDRRTPEDLFVYSSPNAGLQNKAGSGDVFTHPQQTRKKDNIEFFVKLNLLSIRPAFILKLNYYCLPI